MNKIYTSVLCMALLVPTVARAEICTDFDDNMNIIEFDCAEGVDAARKRIVAEREKVRAAAERQVEQERIAAENAATAKRQAEEQRKAAERAEREKQKELERATREKQRELERAEREKQRAAERTEREKEKEIRQAERKSKLLRQQQKIDQGGCWTFVAGLGATGWIGKNDNVLVGKILPEDNYVIQDALYSVSDFTLDAELGARYYFKDNARWFAQISMAYSSSLEHEIDLKRVYDNSNIGKILEDIGHIYLTSSTYSLQTLVGRKMAEKTYLYGKFGVGYMDYAKSGGLWFEGLGLKDALVYTFGAGIEYDMWTWALLYGGMDITTQSGGPEFANTLISFNAGVRLRF